MLCLALAGAMRFAAVVNAQAGTPQKYDSWITAKTKIALFSDSRVKGREINVETKAGQVMLRGKVDNDEAKAAAADIAQGIKGVQSVKNELQVVAPADRAAVTYTDDMIMANVKDALKDVRHSHIGVKVNAGVVSLNGHSNSWQNSAKASWRAWNVNGVVAVKNDITVKG